MLQMRTGRGQKIFSLKKCNPVVSDIRNDKSITKIICYTVLTGNYDRLYRPDYISNEWDYVCFTDQPIKKSGPWKRHPLRTVINGDPTRTCRWHKMHPHRLFPNHEFSIYLDANIQITGPHLELRTGELIADHSLLAIPPHPERNCIYEEVNECIQTNRDSTARIRDMEQLLIREDFPAGLGLLENNIIFRRHNAPSIIQIDEAWWDLISRHSSRDQLSLMYLLWKRGMEAKPIVPAGQTIRNYPGYRYRLHNHLLPPTPNPVRRKVAQWATVAIPVRRWRRAARTILTGRKHLNQQREKQ